MRHVIKKILKEEGLEWIQQSKGEDSILDFVNDRMRTPNFRHMLNWDNRKLYNQFDEVHSALNFLESDLDTAAKAAKRLNESTNYDEMVDNLGEVEDYATIGSMIESVRFGLYFFRPFIQETGYPMDKILEYLTNYYNN